MLPSRTTLSPLITWGWRVTLNLKSSISFYSLLDVVYQRTTLLYYTCLEVRTRLDNVNHTTLFDLKSTLGIVSVGKY
jgi:hypothetical protein